MIFLVDGFPRFKNSDHAVSFFPSFGHFKGIISRLIFNMEHKVIIHTFIVVFQLILVTASWSVSLVCPALKNFEDKPDYVCNLITLF